MKRHLRYTFLCSRTVANALVIGILCSIACLASAQEPENEDSARAGRAEYDLMRFMDPATRCIPENIRARELQFAFKLSASAPGFKNSAASAQSVNWASRGPVNVGARTKALGIDVANENIILAGGTTGGMWRSTDRGASWVRTTPLSVLPSTTALAQDTRVGKTKTWYYGTGEFVGNTGGYPLWLNEHVHKWGEYYGNGIFKSTDDGVTWNVLASTASDSIGAIVQPFNFVHKIAVDPSKLTEDVVYAAVVGGIERSSDGGTSWSMVLGAFPDGPAFTDVAVTSNGVVYAVLGSFSATRMDTSSTGIYRTMDGIHWVNITPAGLPAAGLRVSVAVAPSNENVVYVAYDPSPGPSVFWKYTYVSGDGTGSGGVFEDRSTNLTASGVIFASIKPDDENTVFVGGIFHVRSTDGFATSGHALELNSPHVDHYAMAFFPSNPASMIVGCDGGLFLTENNLASTIQWTNLNNGYVTSQFYTLAIDHATPGDMTIIGGLQDNYTNFTNSPDATYSWTPIGNGDGGTCAIADGRTSYYVSYASGTASPGATYRKLLDDQGGKINETRIDPIATGSAKYLFINPFCLDPTNTNRMYFGGGSHLWRNDDVTAIPLGGGNPTIVGWTKLTLTMLLPIDSIIHTPMITAITSTRTPANRVYYGTTDGRLFRLDSANAADPSPKAIWEGKGFPKLAYVSSIATDSKNADNAIVAFANYSVLSLFFTSDGGTSWVPIGGNLEEYPDGKGSGPSCRAVAMMHSGNGMIYLVGTSTGLYSTTTLNGMSTIWTLEGPTTIGNNIVNAIDTRESDGMVAVATCGHGMFSGQFAPASSVSPGAPTSSPIFELSPNPTTGAVTVHCSTGGIQHVSVISVLGENVMEMSEPVAPDCTFDLLKQPAGVYFVRIVAEGLSATKMIVKQ